MSFEDQANFNRKLFTVIKVKLHSSLELLLLEGLTVKYVFRNLFELDQRWRPLWFCQVGCLLLGQLKWCESHPSASIGFGLRGTTQLREYVLPASAFH